MAIERIYELDYNPLLTSDAMFPYYSPAVDTTFRINAGDFLFGLYDAGDAWNEFFSYALGDVVTYDGEVWISAENDNEGNPPGPASTSWDLEPDPEPIGIGPYWPLSGNADFAGNVYISGDETNDVGLGMDGMAGAGKMLGNFYVRSMGVSQIGTYDSGNNYSEVVLTATEAIMSSQDGFGATGIVSLNGSVGSVFISGINGDSESQIDASSDGFIITALNTDLSVDGSNVYFNSLLGDTPGVGSFYIGGYDPSESWSEVVISASDFLAFIVGTSDTIETYIDPLNLEIFHSAANAVFGFTETGMKFFAGDTSNNDESVGYTFQVPEYSFSPYPSVSMHRTDGATDNNTVRNLMVLKRSLTATGGGGAANGIGGRLAFLVKNDRDYTGDFDTNDDDNYAEPVGIVYELVDAAEASEDGKYTFEVNAGGAVTEPVEISDAGLSILGSARGLILQSPDTNFWIVQVTNAGALTVTPV